MAQTLRRFDQSGQAHELGAELARGGEGAVFDLPGAPGLVAKLYHGSPSAEKAQKLQWMVQAQSADLLRVAAWPTATLHAQPQGPVVGFIMPRISGFKEIHLLYSLHSRRREFPDASWAFLLHVAMNCAIAFDAIHQGGHLIADVNQKNVLVSPKDGTVRLIDCDSFQIQAGGAALLCDVGVPEFTPPELQGKSFRSVVRTSNHDRFGLAVLIFHLLFVGRHPFSGRFLGAGEMPLERAISELRFAFGRDASARQVAPPPFSLPLSVLPGDVSALFEHAFAERAISAERPSPLEWHRRLGALLKQLVSCTKDAVHRYPAHLSECPWCAVLDSGGPAFFLSIQIGPIEFVCDASELAGLFAQLDPLRAPALASSAPVLTVRAPQPLTPAALAAQAQIPRADAVLLLAAGLVLLALIQTLALESPLALPLGAAGGVVALFGASWRWWLAHHSPGARERQQRQAAFAQASDDIRRVEAERSALGRARPGSQDELRARLDKLRGEYLALKPAYEQERRHLASDRTTAQRNAYLDSFLIEAHTIDKIKDGRKAVLRSHDIESAYDVLHKDLSAVPGFGPVLRKALVDWARQIEAGFRFDPSKDVPETERRALLWKYQQRKVHLRGQIEKTIKEIEAQTMDSEARARELSVLLRDRRTKQAEAWGDLSVA